MEIKEVKEQTTLAVNVTTSVAELPKTIGSVFGDIMAHTQRKNIPIAGPPYVLYRNMDMQALQVEIGFPVGRIDAGEGRVEPALLPAGKVARAVHKGSYATIERTYTELMAFVATKGLKTKPWMYEQYLNSPENTPESELLTEVSIPIAT